MSRLPFFSRVVLKLFAASDEHRAVVSELHELYDQKLETHGEAEARRWFRRQARHYVTRLPIDWLVDRRLLREPSRGGHRGFTRLWRNFTRDLRHSARSLAKAPVFMLTVVITVGVGIGGTTAVFSIVDAVLIQPLPYDTPERLWRIYTASDDNRWPFSVADYLALTEQQTSFDNVAAYRNTTATLNMTERAERISAREVTASYFPLLGVSPVLGRPLASADERPGAQRVALVSNGFWQRYMGADLDAVGRTIRIDGSEHTVAGVLPPDLGPLDHGREVFPALQLEPPARKGPFFLTPIGRLRNDVSAAVAGVELHAINQRLFPIWQDSYSDRESTWRMMDLKEFVIGDIATSLGVALASVAFVLLIASTNAANLLVARTAKRRAELAVRAALGASRRDLISLVGSESVLLAVLGGGVGLVMTLAASSLVSSAGADFLPRAFEVGLTPTVMTFFLATVLGSLLVFGIVPALGTITGQTAAHVPTSGVRSTAGRGQSHARRALVGFQFAVSVPLLVGAGLLLVSLMRLNRVDLGFDTTNVLTARISLPAATYAPQSLPRFWNDVTTRVAGLPGVLSAGVSVARPPREYPFNNNQNLVDKPTPPGETQVAVPWNMATPGYFDVLGVRVVRGRMFDEHDSTRVLVDETWAERFYPNEDVIGKRFTSGGCTNTGCPQNEIVGVVGDITYTGIENVGEGTVYMNFDVYPNWSAFLTVRTAQDAATLVAAVRNVVREIDPTVPLSEVATMEELVRDALQAPRYLTLLIAGFAVVALVLAVVGIYGVMTYFVQQQTRDIGIRLALGGRPRTVGWMVIGRGMAVVMVGIAVGLVIALGLSRYIQALLYDVVPADPVTIGMVGVVIVSFALVACIIPARRASRTDPAAILRADG